MSLEYIHNEPLHNLRQRIAFLTEVKGYSPGAIAAKIQVDRGNFYRAAQEDSTSRRDTLIRYVKKIDEEYKDDLQELLQPINIPDLPPQDVNRVSEKDLQLLAGPIKNLSNEIGIYNSNNIRQQAIMELLTQFLAAQAGKTEAEFSKMVEEKILEIENRKKDLPDTES